MERNLRISMTIYGVLLALFHASVLVHPESFCTIQIESSQDFVLIGQTTIVNCTSNCSNVYWESRWAKLKTIDSDYSSSVLIHVTDWADSPIQCLVDKDGTEHKAVARVIPYVLPSSVDIELKEVLEEDKEHEVTCLVNGVAPVKYVILSVIRRGELLVSRTYERDITEGPHNLKETFKFTASHEDNHQEFTCQVSLNLTGVNDTTVWSSPVTVRTYALPEDPRITAEEWVESGTATNVTCDVQRGFPPENIITKLSIEGFPDNVGAESVLSTVNPGDLPPGRYNITCTCQVYNALRTGRKVLYVYEPPVVNFTVSSSRVNVGDTVTLRCSIIKGSVEYLSLSLRKNREHMKEKGSPELTENITITSREPRLSVACVVFLQANDNVLWIWQENITVYYPPEFSDRSCPGSIVWVEAERRTFGCRSEGNPTPEEECRLKDSALQSSTSFTAERNMAGVYTCQASNAVGNVAKSVEVTVQYPPGPPSVNISAPSIAAGKPVTLTCSSDALPSPTYRWEHPPQSQVDMSQDRRSITIRDASSYHQGTYTCHVTNIHGRTFASQDLTVISDKTTLWGILIGVAVLIVVVGLIGFIIYYLNQKGKVGFYDLVRRIPGNIHNAEVPLQENSTV